MTTVENEAQKLLSQNPQDNQKFGKSVSISGNYAIVGTVDSTVKSNQAYIYELSNGTWSAKQILNPTIHSNTDKVGYSVSMSGNYAIISAWGYQSNKGRAHIYELSNGTWTEKQQITASDSYSQAKFSSCVAISGNYAIISQPGTTGTYGSNTQGCVYIFELSNGTWTEKQKLKASDSVNGDEFGYSVAINGNYAIVGCRSRSSFAGSAYIFELSNGNWGTAVPGETYRTETQKIAPSELASGDQFGWSVAISGSNALVSSVANSDSGSWTGSAYIFERDGDGNWTEKQKLLASDKAGGDSFGHFVSIDGNNAIIASRGDSEAGSFTGAAYLFQFSNDTWSETKKFLASDKGERDFFGSSVAINGNYAFVGSTDEDNSGKTNSGAAYIFEVSGGSSVSTEEQSLTDLNIESTDIDTLKAVSFSSKANGKGNPDATARAKMKSLITSEGNATNKRKKRRAVLKLLFSQDTDVTKMVIPKEDLQLPDGFTKTNALVVKAGGSLNITDLSSDEGFYSVLDDGETIAITTDNTTLTFTRQDVGDNELYTVSASTWTDIVINSDNVSGGTFTDSNNTGTLAPDDSVTIDGRIFIIGSVADGGTGGSGGDPYVFPIKSNTPVKLPNKPAVYRMFEQGDNYVNVEVGRATDTHKQRMFNYARKLTPVTHNIVMDWYFYQKAFISAEGRTLTIDYDTKKANCDEESAEFFKIKQSKKLFDCGEFKEDASCWTIGWTTKENKKIQVQLMFFPNPHIENGINVIPSTLKNSTGLIVDNYKPKLMELPSLTTEKFGKLHRRLSKSKNIHQKMNIKGKNEKWCFN